jgi:hypothetical protein
LCMYFVVGIHLINPNPDMHSITFMVFIYEKILLGALPLILCIYAGILMQRGMNKTKTSEKSNI